MGEVDADVVEHGAGFDEAKVGAEFGMSASDVEGAAAHLAAVEQEQATQRRVDGVVAEEEGAVVHGRGVVLRSSRGALGLSVGALGLSVGVLGLGAGAVLRSSRGAVGLGAGAFFPSLSGRGAS